MIAGQESWWLGKDMEVPNHQIVGVFGHVVIWGL